MIDPLELLTKTRCLYSGDDECTTGAGCVGGHLHIVLDDGNVSDSHVSFCLVEARRDSCETCMAIAKHLLLLSGAQRLVFYGMLHGPIS